MPDQTRWRQWLAYLLPWTAILVLGTGAYYRARFVDELQTVKDEHRAVIASASRDLFRVIQRTMSDALVLASTGDFERFIEEASPAGQADLAEEWTRFLRIKQVYDQVRFLDDSGRERLRVNYNGGLPAAVPPARLQDKSNRPYFRETMALARGQFYVSPLDLNIEENAVEIPHKPMLRFALPVFDRKGRRRGVFVLNFLADDLLARLDALEVTSDTRLMLFNADGYWLHGAERGDEWAFMFDRPVTAETRFPGSWAPLAGQADGQRQDTHGIWTWASFFPAVEGAAINSMASPDLALARPADQQVKIFWKIVALTPVSRTREIEQRLDRQFGLTVGLGFALLMLAAWRLLAARHRQESAERQLRSLNESLEAQVGERTRRLQNEIFDRQMAERRYRESSEQYQHMIATTVDGYWLLDDRGGFLDINPSACEMLRAPREVLLSMTIADLESDPQNGTLEKCFADLMLTASSRFETRLRRMDKSIVDVEISASYLADYLRFVAFVRDISERKQLERERRLAAMVMNNTDEAVLVVNAEGIVMSANPAFAKITGIPGPEAIGEQVNQIGLSSIDGAITLGQLLPGHSRWRGEMRGRRRSGEVYPVWLSATMVRDDDDRIKNYVCVFSDITEIKESQARLDFLAHHDALTGLANRLLFRARLEHSIERASRSQKQVAVLFLDLDHFKDVNDTLGHAIGDQLLIDLAGAFTNCLRAEDTLARLGGDEFVVLIEQVSGRESIETVLEKFWAVFPWSMGNNQRIEVTASIGIAIFPDNARDADTLVMAADAAMYRAKEGGRNRAVYA